MREDILAQFDPNRIKDFRETEGGDIKFSMVMQLGAGEKKRFRVAWQIDHTSDIPRLITAYREDTPEEKKRKRKQKGEAT